MLSRCSSNGLAVQQDFIIGIHQIIQMEIIKVPMKQVSLTLMTTLSLQQLRQLDSVIFSRAKCNSRLAFRGDDSRMTSPDARVWGSELSKQRSRRAQWGP